jgi:hypothetical protein
MKIKELIWLPDVIEKLVKKHAVEPHEVEEVTQVPLLEERATTPTRMCTLHSEQRTKEGI